jgi:hypothetical protein
MTKKRSLRAMNRIRQRTRDRFQAEYKLGNTIRPAHWGSLKQFPNDDLSHRADKAMRRWLESRPDGTQLRKELGA